MNKWAIDNHLPEQTLIVGGLSATQVPLELTGDCQLVLNIYGWYQFQLGHFSFCDTLLISSASFRREIGNFCSCKVQFSAIFVRCLSELIFIIPNSWLKKQIDIVWCLVVTCTEDNNALYQGLDLV